MDGENLGPEQLKSILSNLPTPDELLVIENYDGDKADLGNADKYYSAIGKIPLLSTRVAAMAYKITFRQKSREC